MYGPSEWLETDDRWIEIRGELIEITDVAMRWEILNIIEQASQEEPLNDEEVQRRRFMARTVSRMLHPPIRVSIEGAVYSFYNWGFSTALSVDEYGVTAVYYDVPGVLPWRIMEMYREIIE